jgi:hypothetical protein
VPDRAVAVVELTTGQATSAGYRVRVAEYEIGDVAGAALYADGYTGHAQMVVDEDRQVILGFANNRRSSPLRSVPIRPVLDAYLAADGIDLSSYLLDRIDQIVPPGVTINVADNLWEFGTTALDAASHRRQSNLPLDLRGRGEETP